MHDKRQFELRSDLKEQLHVGTFDECWEELRKIATESGVRFVSTLIMNGFSIERLKED